MPVERATDSALCRLARQIIERPGESWPLSELAARHGLSAAAFQRRFVALFGVSPRQLRDAARMGQLKQALRAGRGVTEAIHEAGFGSTSRVYEPAQRDLGMTLSAYRKGAAGEEISWAARRTGLGWLLMAATARGVCFAQFGSGRHALLADLQREFPRARLTASSAGDALDAWIEALERHLAGRAPRPQLPLDLRGTAFQIQVWEFLVGLHEGETRSYGELAAALGRPRAARAAAAACAANRVAVLVPCHRVLRGDGSLGGYRWGEARKRALLRGEGVGA
ncbi:bifunctional transcriptional activator/DNA repair enzyme AdaA [Pseudomarimonas salicorniae]|uniref:Methylated-DNA--[protein]-cysteine S-methyltransferase n=1 Tax=Pseudomarimonas salicorniae TaxID=2933270 RepID=A0ABT0GIY5_9GAMM|nr:methylated-DNA--[protein]-cysteine S-methyltransferase [Lysobacter sp. CAU 1642]MCK7594503.1 methylated-DNA--[protein]-cysteine S-methyltransferase [Lysobacter sp. CAU 1642]